VLEVMAMLARLKRVADAAKVRIWPGNNIGYFGPYETLLRGTLPRGHMASCGAGRSTLGIEADGAIKGCPSLPTKEYVGRQHPRQLPQATSGSAPAPLRFTRDRTVDDLWGYCRDCYYNDTCRAGCSWTTHVLLGRPGNNPYCHHRALELLRKGLASAWCALEAAPGSPSTTGSSRSSKSLARRRARPRTATRRDWASGWLTATVAWAA
jgi:radical SAM protein with 4Fe4S-binding SPASM domain